MIELFISYNEALELKELGFDEQCFAYYNSNKNLHLGDKYYSLESDINASYVETKCQDDKACLAPLYQQAFKWFREKHNLYALIIPTAQMYWTFKTMTVVEGVVEVPPYEHVDANDYSNYEEAELECLKTLIKIIKNE